MIIGATYYCYDFHTQPAHEKVVCIEVAGVPSREWTAIEGPNLDAFERRMWRALFNVAGAPPPGYSSWLSDFRYYPIKE